DTLPPYEVLDPILKAYVEDDRSFSEMIDMGFDKELVQRVIRLVDINEYKRRQAAPGVKITPRAFGRDRRMPITNRFRSWTNLLQFWSNGYVKAAFTSPLGQSQTNRVISLSKRSLQDSRTRNCSSLQ